MILSKYTTELFEHKLKTYRASEKYYYEKCYSNGKYNGTNKSRDLNTYRKYKNLADDLEKLLRISKDEKRKVIENI